MEISSRHQRVDEHPRGVCLSGDHTPHRSSPSEKRSRDSEEVVPCSKLEPPCKLACYIHPYPHTPRHLCNRPSARTSGTRKLEPEDQTVPEDQTSKKNSNAAIWLKFPEFLMSAGGRGDVRRAEGVEGNAPDSACIVEKGNGYYVLRKYSHTSFKPPYAIYSIFNIRYSSLTHT